MKFSGSPESIWYNEDHNHKANNEDEDCWHYVSDVLKI